MTIDFHWIADFLIRWPVLWVLLLAALFGTGLTLLIKQSYLTAVMHKPPNPPLYRLLIRWLSGGLTTMFSVGLWHTILTHSGAEEWVCAGWGLSQPLLYDATRALVATRWPDFAAKWGSHENDA